jgi:hypothetical protein
LCDRRSLIIFFLFLSVTYSLLVRTAESAVMYCIRYTVYCYTYTRIPYTTIIVVVYTVLTVRKKKYDGVYRIGIYNNRIKQQRVVYRYITIIVRIINLKTKSR